MYMYTVYVYPHPNLMFTNPILINPQVTNSVVDAEGCIKVPPIPFKVRECLHECMHECMHE